MRRINIIQFILSSLNLVIFDLVSKQRSEKDLVSLFLLIFPQSKENRLFRVVKVKPIEWRRSQLCRRRSFSLSFWLVRLQDHRRSLLFKTDFGVFIFVKDLRRTSLFDQDRPSSSFRFISAQSRHQRLCRSTKTNCPRHPGSSLPTQAISIFCSTQIVSLWINYSPIITSCHFSPDRHSSKPSASSYRRSISSVRTVGLFRLLHLFRPLHLFSPDHKPRPSIPPSVPYPNRIIELLEQHNTWSD